MSVTLWERCLNCLQDEFSSQQFNTWIRPLQVQHEDNILTLFAPNRFVLDWINERFLTRIKELVIQLSEASPPHIQLEIGSQRKAVVVEKIDSPEKPIAKSSPVSSGFRHAAPAPLEVPNHQSNINPNFRFDNFVEGKSNQLAKAASLQVGENPV